MSLVVLLWLGGIFWDTSCHLRKWQLYLKKMYNKTSVASCHLIFYVYVDLKYSFVFSIISASAPARNPPALKCKLCSHKNPPLVILLQEVSGQKFSEKVLDMNYLNTGKIIRTWVKVSKIANDRKCIVISHLCDAFRVQISISTSTCHNNSFHVPK